MEEFFPGQRYASDGEPELGIGIITEVSRRQLKLHFPAAEETRIYALDSAPLRRVVFKPGDAIVDTKGKKLLVEEVQMVEGLYQYFGNKRAISEQDLGNVSISRNVEDRLFSGDIDAPALFALRRESHYHNHQRRISPVNGFVGGKIDLIPHQLYIANEVSSRHAPRVLLSDQVGLGKTIEACLILHRLLLNERISRVMIVVPESLMHQWFVEVLRKFNLWFHIFDEERCAALEEGAPEGNPFLDDQLVICSIEFLAASKKRTAQAVSANWDMLVVDEAHHLEWSVNHVSPEYQIVELLSKVAKGLLLLTATPEQLGVESHFARLRLLDPNRYASYDDFLNEEKDHKSIADVVEKLSSDQKLLDEELKQLESLFSKERVAQLKQGNTDEKHRLMEDLLDQHGPGRVLFRNTRAAMTGFPKRIAHIAPIEASEPESACLEHLTAEFGADMALGSGSQQQKFHFDTDPRVHWLLQKMKELAPAKILLICTTKEKALALEAALSEHMNGKVSVFHEDLTLIQRDRNSAWFADAENAQMLICSEIGSEGRNFQFAHHLVLFDLPNNPELLEQRIGRLDRIGQREDIHIHIPYVEASPQQMLVKWYHEGLNAFTNHLEGGSTLSKRFKNRFFQLAQQGTEDSSSELDALVAETADFQKALKQQLAEGRDRLLEMNSFRPKVAQDIIEQIQEQDNDQTLERYLTRVFDHFDVEMEDLAARSYLLQPTSITATVFPSIPREGIQITFDRKRSLSREDVRFVSWDHPVTTDAIDVVLSSSTGSASFGVLRGTGSPSLLLELIFIVETGGRQNTYVDRFLPNTPIRIVVDHAGTDVTEDYPEDLLNKNLIAGKMGSILKNDMLVERVVPNMISTATNIAEDLGADKIVEGLITMKATLNHEIERLESLQSMNQNIRPEEIETAIEERNTLSSIIQNARIRLDALQLIRQE